MRVWRTEMPRLQFGSASYPRFVDWRARSRVFEELGAFAPRGLTLTGHGAPERIGGARATASLFDVLGLPPVRGRYYSETEDQPGRDRVVVLGEQLWRTRFGADPAILGSTLTLDAEPHIVIGVAPAAYQDVWRFEAWVPLAMAVDESERGSNFLVPVGRLRDGVTMAAAAAGMAELAAELRRDRAEDRYGFHLLTQHEVMVQSSRAALWILLGTTGLVLLIACANVANLLLARAVPRQREMAVRTALGAGRGRLLRQLLTETVLLALLGGALGVGLAGGLLRLFTLVAPANFPRLGDIGLDLRVLAFAVAASAAAGILAGVLPGLQVSRAEPADALRAGGTRGATAGGARSLSRLLVVSEIGLAVMLVAAAGLSIRSLQAVLDQDLGLRADGVLTFTVSVPPGENSTMRASQLFATLEARLRAMPGVVSAGAINMLPIANTGYNGPVTVPGRVVAPEDAPLSEFRMVTPGYFDTMGVALLAGRLPDSRDAADGLPVVVINLSLARALWPALSPADVVGHQLGLGDPSGWREVIGVTEDVRSRRPDQPADGESYVPYAQFPVTSMAFTVRATGDPEALIPSARAGLAALDPTLPLASVRTFRDVVAAATHASRMNAVLAAFFGALAAALAIVGIYSVMSYAVAQRGRELAIRAALGASRDGLLRLILREGFVLSAIGIAAGLAGGIALSGILRSVLYEVSATDPGVFALTAAAVAVLSLVGYLVPALRASRVEPAAALLGE